MNFPWGFVSINQSFLTHTHIPMMKPTVWYFSPACLKGRGLTRHTLHVHVMSFTLGKKKSKAASWNGQKGSFNLWTDLISIYLRFLRISSITSSLNVAISFVLFRLDLDDLRIHGPRYCGPIESKRAGFWILDSSMLIEVLRTSTNNKWCFCSSFISSRFIVSSGMSVYIYSYFCYM